MKKESFSLSTSLFLASLVILGVVSAATAATVTTDRSDYPLGSTAIITGSGFASGESVQVQAVHADGRVDTDADHNPWQVIADTNGNFTTSWCVCEADDLDSTLVVTAIGISSGSTASATFTDGGATVDFSQYVNGNLGTNDASWVSGSINANKAFYTEGMCVPQRLFLLGISGNSSNTHVMQFQVLATKSGDHALDFMTTWDAAIA